MSKVIDTDIGLMGNQMKNGYTLAENNIPNLYMTVLLTDMEILTLPRYLTTPEILGFLLHE